MIEKKVSIIMNCYNGENFLNESLSSVINQNYKNFEHIIVDGAISEVVVLKVGKKYNSAPDLEISGEGIGAIITPVFENDQITSVTVVSGGTGYAQESTTVSFSCSERNPLSI